MTSFGAYGHSVFDTFVQLTEGRSWDISKQPPAKNIFSFLSFFFRTPLAQAFGSSCLGSRAHQRAVGGQLKGSCSLSYFPVGSERC